MSMSEHDRIRKERAEACDLADEASVIDAIRGLQSTDDPSLATLHDQLQRRLRQLERRERTQNSLTVKQGAER